MWFCLIVYVCAGCVFLFLRALDFEFLLHDVPCPSTGAGWACDVFFFEKPHDNKRCAGNISRIKPHVIHHCSSRCQSEVIASEHANRPLKDHKISDVRFFINITTK